MPKKRSQIEGSGLEKCVKSSTFFSLNYKLETATTHP